MVSYDVIVLGLGSTGSSILYNLVKEGVSSILGIDARCPGCGQTSRSSALIRVHYTHPVIREMAVYSWRFWTRYVEETGYDRDVFHQTGIGFAGGDEHIDNMEEVVSSLRRLGVDVDLYDPEIFRREYYKKLNIGGLSVVAWEPNSGYCDAYDAVQGFIKYAVKNGADIKYPEKVVGLEVEDGYITTVKTDKNVYKADYVVNALGVWSNEVLKILGIELPIRLAREDVVYVSQKRDIIPFGWGDFVEGFYSRPDGGSRYLIGGLEPEFVDTEPEPGEYTSPPLNIIKSRVDPASRRFPSLEEAVPVSAIYGFYDVTPDFQPIIGYDEKYPNLIHMVGLSGHGFKLAPAYGKVISEIVKYGESRRFNIDGLTIKRFKMHRDARSKYKYGLVG